MPAPSQRHRIVEPSAGTWIFRASKIELQSFTSNYAFIFLMITLQDFFNSIIQFDIKPQLTGREEERIMCLWCLLGLPQSGKAALTSLQNLYGHLHSNKKKRLQNLWQLVLLFNVFFFDLLTFFFFLRISCWGLKHSELPHWGRAGTPKKAESGTMSGSKETPALPDFLEITLKIQEILLEILFLPPVGAPSLQPRGTAIPSSWIPQKPGFPAQNPIALLLWSVFEEGCQRSLIKIPFFSFLGYLSTHFIDAEVLRLTGMKIKHLNEPHNPLITWLSAFPEAKIISFQVLGLFVSSRTSAWIRT